VDAIAEGNAPRALAQLSDLVPAHSAQAAAIPLLGMIARQLRLMWQAAYLASCGAPVDRGGKVAAGVTDLLPEQQNVLAAARSSFMARKLARQARNFGDQEIAFALERVLQADRALKGQTAEQLDPRLVMERLVTELCLLARRAARTGTR
jgi:DNA polymerase III delta subunit